MQAKNYLIVGGTKGIGRSLTEKVAQEGHHPIVISRTPGAGDLNGADYYRADVLEDLPEIDVELAGLAYCPGSILLKPFRSLKTKDFKQDFEINVLGAVKVIQQYLPNLKRAGQASILLFSTVAVQVGLPFHGSVAASKGAIEGLTRSLAAELAPVIRVNAIAPSLTETSLSENLLRNEKSRQASIDRHPLQRIGQPNDIAEAAWFALSDKFSWATGQVISVDGGLSAVRKL